MLPRWLAILLVYIVLLGFFVFLVLQVVPPIIREFESLGSKAPGYVQDFRQWANQNQEFQDLNRKYDITQTLTEQASSIPSKLGGAAGEVRSVTVSILEHLLAAITILALTFFLLLDGRQQGERLLVPDAARHGHPRCAGSRLGSPASSSPTSRSTCCSRSPPASSPGWCSSCSASIWR